LVHSQKAEGLARRLGLFDATMLVMGGIIGSGIFMNPAVTARRVHTTFLLLAVWALGGLVALAAAFIWAELATARVFDPSCATEMQANRAFCERSWELELSGTQ